MSKNLVLNKITQLARVNGTTGLLQEVLDYVDKNYEDFAEDYKCTSQKDRYSTGKLEKKLFTYLADLCKWTNANDNAKCASSILAEVGYHSYKAKEKRFRQKVENEKKKKKKGAKSRTTRHIRKRVSPTIIKRSEMEDSYSENEDLEDRDVYFPINKVINCKQNRHQSYEVTNPLHCRDKNEVPQTRSQAKIEKMEMQGSDANKESSDQIGDQGLSKTTELSNSLETTGYYPFGFEEYESLFPECFDPGIYINNDNENVETQGLWDYNYTDLDLDSLDFM